MPDGGTLSNLIKTNVDSNMEGVSGTSPLGMDDPSYFEQMCEAVGNGIADESTSIDFTTEDEGLLLISGGPATGSGTGIDVDDSTMSMMMYTHFRDSVISKHGSTTHEAWPPSSGNSGEFLKALTDGICKGVKDHFISVYSLESTHSTITNGIGIIISFSGLSKSAVKSAIEAYGTSMVGSGWGDFCQSVADGYVDGIHNYSTGEVTIVGGVPGSSGTGNGSGVAT